MKYISQTISKIALSLLVSTSLILSPSYGVALAAEQQTGATQDAPVVTNATIFLVDPQAATVDIPSIAVRGSDWGPYDNRGTTRAWFVDQETNQMFELKVDRNYRDCMFSVSNGNLAGGCSDSIKKDELFLRLEIPENLKLFLQPKTYVIYVRTDNNIQAAVPFTLLGKPIFEGTPGAHLTITPSEGPYGTYAVLFGSGFPKGEGLTVRFDGIRMNIGGYLSPNPDGTFDNVHIIIPRTQALPNGKTINVAPGKHTIEASNDNAKNMARASVTFIITDKTQTDTDKKKQELEDQKKKDEALKEEARLKKEKEQADKEQALIEQQRKDLEKQLQQKQIEEQKQKDEIQKEQLRKQEEELQKKLDAKKKEEQQKEQKVEDVKKKQENVADKFCDANLPLTFQPGCIQSKKSTPKNKFDGLPCDANTAITLQPGCVSQKPIEQQTILFSGKPCSSILPITFQPGCVSQTPTAPQKPYTGKVCDTNIPIVWQEGCVQQQKTVTASPYQGKACSADLPITFQPGCVSQAPMPPQKPYAGKMCDTNLPLVWQEGCIKPQATQQTSTTTTTTTPSQQTTTTTTTTQSAQPQKCDPNIPHYSQPNCVQ